MGTNKGSELFPVPLRDWDEEERVSVELQRKILKDRFVEVAGDEQAKLARATKRLRLSELASLPPALRNRHVPSRPATPNVRRGISNLGRGACCANSQAQPQRDLVVPARDAPELLP